ncbi:MAG: ATP-binding cassette domain-containing protein [Armatimonadetes bacterium]|nr:ATP-binding cassette domain-containing protein [Armatimonadota bacterium]
MSEAAVRAEGLGKRYRLGSGSRTHDTLRDRLAEAPRAFVGRIRKKPDSKEPRYIWALRDLNFELERGGVLGVIGPNGAGKSTLLKILSRITQPTEGRIGFRGRIGSLLEVGTGFHGELSGRENIYLSGTILGMKRAEIRRKFDEIVDFAEIGSFLDTPVKRYSSGMYVRLGFAVAAHLDPEILVVDEVLAVGDMAFQKKCLGRMGDVAQSGRTVLFVSHNMDMILNICRQGLLLDRGNQIAYCPIDEAVSTYYSLRSSAEGSDRRELNSVVAGINATSADGRTFVCPSGGEIVFDLDLRNLEGRDTLYATLVLTDQAGRRIVLFQTLWHSQLVLHGARKLALRCTIPSLPLVPDVYYVDVLLHEGGRPLENVQRACTVEVLPADPLRTGNSPQKGQGYLVVPAEWEEIERA